MTLEEILRQAQSKPCTCGGAWIPAALDILWQNWINPFDFARAILLNLRHGPKKGLTIADHTNRTNKPAVMPSKVPQM